MPASSELRRAPGEEVRKEIIGEVFTEDTSKPI